MAESKGSIAIPSGTINCSFEDGKAYIGLGMYAVDGTYKIEGDKIIATGDFGLMLPHTVVFTINKDGSSMRNAIPRSRASKR